MYTTGPGGSTATGGLAVRRAAHTRPGPRAGVEPRPETRAYLADMLRLYGVPYDDERLRGGSQRTYAELTTELVAALHPERLDMVVVAHSAIDCDVQRLIATAAGPAGRDALCFAITDQGPLAAFTAVRLARAYARGGACERVAVLVLHQSTLPYADADADPDGDRGVSLLLEKVDDADADDVTVRSVAPSQVATLVREAARRLAGRQTGTVVLLGPGAAEADLAGEMTVVACPASPGQVELWAAAAGHLSDGLASRVVVVDYDARRGELAALALRRLT